MQLLTGENRGFTKIEKYLFVSLNFSDFKAPKNNFPCHGTLHNKNTIESFKDCDKSKILKEEGEKLFENIVNGKCLDDPSLLVSFALLSFAVSHKNTAKNFSNSFY